jgi:hypothetical protein
MYIVLFNAQVNTNESKRIARFVAIHTLEIKLLVHEVVPIKPVQGLVTPKKISSIMRIAAPY